VRLLATFNAGFKLEDSGGGFFAGGRSYAPLRDGQATLIAYRDGRVDVREWAGGTVPGPDVVFARQNLPVIVSGGPALAEPQRWPGMGPDAGERRAGVAIRRGRRRPR
jgi:hypothetical protein